MSRTPRGRCGRRYRRITASSSAVLIAAALGVTACGSSTSNSAETDGSSTSKGTPKRIVAFTFASSETYVAALQRGMKESAAEEDIDVKIYENNFDAAQQNSQIQQELGSGSKPDAYVVQMADPGALTSGIVALAATNVPLFLTNQFPTDQQAGLMTAYAGVSDVQIGKNGAELLVEARDQMRAGGAKLHSAGGNAVFIDIFPSVAASQQRTKGFTEGLEGSGIKLLAHAYGATDPSTGFAKMQALIAAHKSDGIDLVFAQNDAIAAGAMQALNEAGLKPGKDVMVVGANCRDDLRPLQDGSQFGTSMQGALLEGRFTVDTVKTYLRNHKVNPTVYQAPASPTKPELPTTISKYNYIPSPAVVNTDVDATQLWGESMSYWCNY